LSTTKTKVETDKLADKIGTKLGCIPYSYLFKFYIPCFNGGTRRVDKRMQSGILQWNIQHVWVIFIASSQS